jgi:hypothetical protein
MRTHHDFPSTIALVLQPIALGNHELIDLLIQDEDRVPRNVIDELARRGDLAVADLEARFSSPEAWAHAVALGAWWPRLHAAMIFGLMPTANAECALVRWMRRMAEADDENLQEWLELVAGIEELPELAIDGERLAVRSAPSNDAAQRGQCGHRAAVSRPPRSGAARARVVSATRDEGTSEAN